MARRYVLTKDSYYLIVTGQVDEEALISNGCQLFDNLSELENAAAEASNVTLDSVVGCAISIVQADDGWIETEDGCADTEINLDTRTIEQFICEYAC